MYLCGHPGTGKTSTLNLVLSQLKQDIKINLLSPIEVVIYNAMGFVDVKNFAIQLLEDLTLKLTGQELKTKINRQTIDDERLSEKIAKVLKLSKPQVHKILVIDEIDAFATYEKAFLTFIKAIIKTNTNTSVIGIANSVGLPFKKNQALSMRDVQLLFSPYSKDQIISILEEKQFKRYNTMPMKLKSSTQSKRFFELVDDQARDLIASKVSKMNGDVRVAFDIMKSCFNKIFYDVKYNMNSIEQPIVVTKEVVLKVFEEKYASKLQDSLASFPRQTIVVLEAVCTLFEYVGEEKKIQYASLFDEVDKELKSRSMAKIDLKQLLNCIDELEYYSIIDIEKSKKEIKNSKFSLKVELAELIKELDRLQNPEKYKEEQKEETKVQEKEEGVIKHIDILSQDDDYTIL